MEIILAEFSGFCLGVKRAVSQAEALAASGGTVNTLGPLIHNPQEVERLKGCGIGVVEDISEAEGSTLVIRAHGAAPDVYEKAREKGINLVDATCPFVLSLQKKARSLADAGYQVVIIGDPTHPEVRGVVGWTEGQAYVVSSFEDLERLPPLERVGIVAQTTQREEFVEAIVSRLSYRVRELRVEKTICRATTERQEAARNLAAKVQVMLVVGGRASSNTQKLATICRDTGAITYQIESAADIDPAWFEGVRRVGITAGASTPDWIVKGVIRRMEELAGKEEAVAVGEAATPEGKKEAGDEQARDEAQNTLHAEDLGTIKTYRPGQTVEGMVVQIGDDHLLVDVGYKSEGVVPLSEASLLPGQTLGSAFSVGQKVPLVVIGMDNEGTLRLSHRRAREREAWRTLEQAQARGDVLEATVIEAVKGGLLLDLGVRAFMPASQVERGYVADLGAYVGRKLRFRIIEFNRGNRRVVVSQRVVLEEEAARQKEKVWAELAEGQVRRGVVKGLTDFGAFIDLGGVDGLLHVSEMSWGRVNHPSDVLSVGDEVQVKILKLDKEKEKISLGLKQVTPNPWDSVEERYQPGKVIQGRVVRIVPFGAFVELEPGVEGLVHISQLADRHVADPREVVQEGDTVSVRVLRASREERRISLSMRQPREAREPRDHRESKEPQPRRREPAGRADSPAAHFEGVTIGDVYGGILGESIERTSEENS